MANSSSPDGAFAREALSEQQETFYIEYLKDFNATLSAKRAGYSEKTAHSQGQRLLKHPEIRRRMEARRARMLKKIEINHENVLFGLARLAFSDVRNVLDWNRNGEVMIKASDEIDDDTAAAIQEVTTLPNGGVKLKLHSKHGPMVDLGKFIGMGQPDMATVMLAKLLGTHGTEQVEQIDPREASRRIAMALKSGRLQIEGER